MVILWIFTSDGFLSAVEHRADANKLMVRARDRKSLENLVAGSQMAGAADGEDDLKYEDIYSEKNSDYAHRIVVSKATFALWVSFEVMNMITYPNFKSEAAKYRSGQWMTSLHGVWHEMNKVDEAPKPAYGSFAYDDSSRGYGTRNVDYDRVFRSSYSAASDDELYPHYTGYAGYESPMFREGYDSEPSTQELEDIEYSYPETTDNIDYLKGQFVEDETGALRWLPFTEEELAAGKTSDFYEGEVFFRKNEAGEWVDVNDTVVPVLPETS